MFLQFFFLDMDVPPEQQQLARRESVANALQKSFCGYTSTILSLGSVLKVFSSKDVFAITATFIRMGNMSRL